MHVKYILGVILSIPLLPILYFQGKRVKATVPSLPEAEGKEGVATAASDKTLQVLLIGESTIAGVGVATHEEGFAGAFGRELATLLQVNVHWKVYARSGYTARKVANKLVPKIAETSPDMILAGLGGNDAFTLNTPWQWQADILQLIDSLQVKFPGKPIFFLNMPPIKEFPAFTPVMKFVIGNLVELHGDALQATVGKRENVYYYGRNITLKDWNERLKIQGSTKDYFSDGVHPSKLTYQTWAKDMAGYLVERSFFTNYRYQTIF
jgi:lysophospholipase L1-like esterase